VIREVAKAALEFVRELGGEEAAYDLRGRLSALLAREDH
jgi:hypothetical protein